eukprot:COSAG04_NODE_6702_length_1273_cov_61.977853_1_plen_78_part_10
MLGRLSLVPDLPCFQSILIPLAGRGRRLRYLARAWLIAAAVAEPLRAAPPRGASRAAVGHIFPGAERSARTGSRGLHL